MNNFERISILGNGISAWMLCAFMAVQLRHTKTQITIHVGMDSESTAEIQSPLPLIHDFLEAIGVASEKFEREVGACAKLGSVYYFNEANPFVHVWGEFGAPKGVIESHQIVMRYLQLNGVLDFNKLSIGSASALSNRFRKPVKDPNSIYSTYESSWSFETERFVRLLKSICVQLGVAINEEKVSGIRGTEIAFDAGDAYQSDYLINTVPELAQEKLLIENWVSEMPYKLSQQVKHSGAEHSLVNKIKANDKNTWVREITERKSTLVQEYHLSDSGAGVYVHSKPRALTSLDFGPAMANLCSPLFTSIDINLIAIKLLSRYFPAPSDTASVINEYNQTLFNAMENLRDISQLGLHFVFKRNNQENVDINISAAAKHKINLFERRGRYPVLDNEFFKPQWQVWLLLGLGFKPDAVEPTVAFVEENIIKEHINQIEKSVARELPFVPFYK